MQIFRYYWWQGFSLWTEDYCKEEARQKALKDAIFFCGGEVSLPPFDVNEQQERHDDAIEPGHWSIEFTYKATFQCVKNE